MRLLQPGRGGGVRQLPGYGARRAPKASLSPEEECGGGPAEPSSRREVYFSETEQAGYYSTPVYERSRLAPGDRLAGPVIIEQMDSTILLLPGQTLRVDAYRNLLIHTFGEEGEL
ncbi:hypothetical protein LJK87_21605 [Paenibacillus sp. P25]|nr:hypothetical protein LJK87_21605 [Paenibacillus sp. P25]